MAKNTRYPTNSPRALKAKTFDDPVIQRIRNQRSGLVTVAEACGRTKQAVSQWKRVPVECVPTVARLLGMKEADVRPDLPHLFRRRK